MNCRKEKLLFSIIIILCFALSGTIYINSQKPSEIFLQDGENEKIGDNEKENNILQEASKIGVHIAGQVKQPGFIWVNEGTRLGEALSYVGGALAEADLDAVNLSKKLMDEEKVYIPKIGETIQGAISESSSGQAGSLNGEKININTAETSELDSLPGIGEAYAKRIIEYRKANGPFKSIEDIKNVTGIGEKRYEAIKDLIMVK